MIKTYLSLFLNLLIHPTHSNVIVRDVLKVKHKKHPDNEHLKAAIGWLVESQNHSPGGGCAASYEFNSGWEPPYPETTGYIISTFLEYASYSRDNSYIDRAVQMADWEIDIQMPTGAVRGGSGINDYPIVFNTGMVISGWCDIFRATGEQKYLKAAKNAANWLCEIQEPDGTWNKFTYNKTPHAYHSRVSWALLKVYEHTRKKKYLDAAQKNVKWTIAEKDSNGWIYNMGFFREDHHPLTHTIAYTLRGLLECSSWFEEDLRSEVQKVVIYAANKLLILYKELPEKALFPGRISQSWLPAAGYSCLTGNAQISIIWIKLYQLTGKKEFLDAARKMTGQLKALQNMFSYNPGIKGGIPGSNPVWGSYMPFSYPNWAAKFFADALLLFESVVNEKHSH